MFEYCTRTFTDGNELQDFLTLMGADNWRLHTCDPIHGEPGYFKVLVVMDRIKDEPATEPQAMEMTP